MHCSMVLNTDVGLLVSTSEHWFDLCIFVRNICRSQNSENILGFAYVWSEDKLDVELSTKNTKVSFLSLYAKGSFILDNTGLDAGTYISMEKRVRFRNKDIHHRPGWPDIVRVCCCQGANSVKMHVFLVHSSPIAAHARNSVLWVDRQHAE